MKVMGAPERPPPAARSVRVAAAPAEKTQGATATHKLLSATLEFSPDPLRQQLSELSDFTVVGVLGSQGVGKSTIMSLLAGTQLRTRRGGGVGTDREGGRPGGLDR